ncbi:MAG: hypothetical protein PHO01_10245 [Desulfotomaculaceae bacterium]|nr:hypothetical protein [Desulfotomaculaceae bacterium]
MYQFLTILASILNNVHDFIIYISKTLGFNPTDEELHFWVIGSIGIFIFLVVEIIFKYIARWSISVISFIFTFAALVVFVFGIEIEQELTGRGSMQFKDIVSGLWGFVVFIGVYFAARIVLNLFEKTWVRGKGSK